MQVKQKFRIFQWDLKGLSVEEMFWAKGLQFSPKLICDNNLTKYGS